MATTLEREERLCALEGVSRETILPSMTENTDVAEYSKFNMTLPYGADVVSVPFGTISKVTFVILRSTKPLQLELDGATSLPTEVTSFEYIVDSTEQGLSALTMVNNSSENICEDDAVVTVLIGGDLE